MKRDWLILAAAVSGAVAIGAGAFGAHGAAESTRELLKTGGLYQMVHSVAAVALVDRARRPAWLMLIGAAVFSVSLYALALGAPRTLGAVTPVGGLAMIGGWLWLGLSRRRRR